MATMTGMGIVIAGLVIEFVAFAGMAFYPVRRALPVRSPIRLQSAGCGLFYLGVLVIVLGQMLS
ncbi:hypothetical protein Mal4_36840 [Maioricimonas rarisocia]|uniref:Uncharacterized protein n=1 Tax=Maioricimonas rarisocia TaxID=2528026 RepID=A0A517ZA35_9PLAN|nr:hypothetical protein [Maioricimonas rarisocia]QDU39343.1 hypothetical protein Mal4_36840 [Maioricimonas rarisocia]